MSQKFLRAARRTPMAAAREGATPSRIHSTTSLLRCCDPVPPSAILLRFTPISLLVFNVRAFVRLSDCPVTISEYEERSHAYTTASSSSWYGHDVRRPMTWCNMGEMTYSGRSSSSYPVPVDYSTVPDAAAAAAAAGSWSLVDLKPCMTPCGLSIYTGTTLTTTCTFFNPPANVYESIISYNMILSVYFAASSRYFRRDYFLHFISRSVFLPLVYIVPTVLF